MEEKLQITLKFPERKHYIVVGYKMFELGTQFKNNPHKTGVWWLELNLGDGKVNVPADNIACIEPYVKNGMIKDKFSNIKHSSVPCDSDKDDVPGHLKS